MSNGWRWFGVLPVPLARAAVQVVRGFGALGHEVGLQDVGEEVVVAVPAATVVERDDEQVGAVERLQHGGAVVAAGDGVAQRTAQPIENRGLNKEIPHTFGLPIEHLVDQVVDDVAVVARESGDEPGDVVAALHRQRGQLQRGDPAFGAPLQVCDVERCEHQSHRFREVSRGFVERETQFGSTDLDEFTDERAAGQAVAQGQPGCRSLSAGSRAGGRAGTPLRPALLGRRSRDSRRARE